MLRTATVAAALMCAAAQIAGSQTILENDQLRLELIGLKRWTIPMIQDSLRRHAPNDSLMSHACAAVLRQTLKFADASVVYYTTSTAGVQSKPYLAVTVVEPQDSGLIRYRGPFRDSVVGQFEIGLFARGSSVARKYPVHLQAVPPRIRCTSMFADACEIGGHFTRPVVTLYHCVDGQVRSGVGSFVVVNDAGWFLSAWHINKGFVDLAAAITTTKAQQAQIAAITTNKALTKNAQKGELRKIGQPDNEAPLDFAVWWGRDGVRAVDITLLEHADLMLGRLEPFDPSWIPRYPAFKDPSSPIRQGTSLCRLGYPFAGVKGDYDEAARVFKFTELVLPPFPIEGIYTRYVEVSQNPAGYRNMYLETSSPGLKGQSGGSILDTKGTVWGIQSRTMNLSLDFDPEVPDGKGGVTKRREHQFLNVGWSTHPETVAGLLKEKGIAHTLAP
jgi:hypothetical protein